MQKHLLSLLTLLQISYASLAIDPPPTKVYGAILIKETAGEMRDATVAELGNPLTPEARFRAVNDYASRNGFLGAFPNFHEATYTQGKVFGMCLIKKEAGEWRDVKASDLGNPTKFEEFFRAVGDYANRNGFAGAFPNFYDANYSQGKVYGVVFLKKEFAEWRDIPVENLGNSPNSESRIRAINDYARSKGFISGFPNFHEADKPNIDSRKTPIPKMVKSPLITGFIQKRADGSTITYYKSNEERVDSYADDRGSLNDNDEGQYENGNKTIRCKTEYRNLNFETMDQDVVDNTTVNRFYPGAVFDLYDVQNVGNFKEVTKEKKPIYLTVLATVVQNPVVTIDNPNENTTRQAMGKLLNTEATDLPKTVERSTIREVYSEEDFKLKIGLAASYGSIKLNSEFNYGSNSNTKKYLLDYKSEWFSVQAKPSNGASSIFKDESTGSGLVYVDKVVYGVRILVAFEQSIESSDISSNTDLKISYGLASGSFNLSVADKSRYDNTTFKVFTWGAKPGTSGVINSVTGIDNLKSILQEIFKDMSNWKPKPASWGLPIAYSLRFVSDNKVAVAQAGLENLPRRTCEVIGENSIIKLQLKSAKGMESTFYGTINVKLRKENGEEIPAIKDQNLPYLTITEKNNIQNFEPTNHYRSYKVTKKDLEGAFFDFNYNINDYDSGSGNDHCNLAGSSKLYLNELRKNQEIVHRLQDDTDKAEGVNIIYLYSTQ